MKKLLLIAALLTANPLKESEIKQEIKMMKRNKDVTNEQAFRAWYKHLRAWEGRLQDPPEAVDLDDIQTKCGVRFTTYKAVARELWGLTDANELLQRFAYMTETEHREIALWFWREARADKVKEGRVAATLAECEWATGHSRSVQRGVKRLGVRLVVDGVTGKQTLSAINKIIERGQADSLFNSICKAHGDHYIKLAGKGRGHIKYLSGWLARHYVGHDSIEQVGFYQRFEALKHKREQGQAETKRREEL